MNQVDQNKTGKLIISLDFELGWGSIENGFWRKRQAAGVYERLRKDMATFIDFLDEREITLSWATVGAMVSDRHQQDFSHIPDELQSKYKEFIDTANPLTADGRDLYELVLRATSRQHICSHTFSHVRFSYPNFTEEAITQDLLLSKASKQDSPSPIQELVFPLNHDPSYKPLALAGYNLGRSKPAYKYGADKGKVAKVMNQIILPPPMTIENVDNDGVTHHSGSMFFNWPGAHTAIRKQYVKNAAYRGLRKAVRDKETLHLWLHPYNLAEIPHLQQELQIYLEEACKLRSKGLLEICPMVK